MVVEVEDPGRVYTDEVSVVTLSCEIYGYPHDSSPPVWTSTSDELQSGRFTTTVTNAGLLNGNSISTTERVVSQLTIFCVSERDSGEYTCSVQGNSTTVTLSITDRGTARYLLIIISMPVSFPPILDIANPIQAQCNCGKHFQCFIINFNNALYYAWQDL